MENINKLDITVIDTSSELHNWVDFICIHPPRCIGLDTEFERRTTHRPILSLIQICVGDRITLIDARCIDDIHYFKKILIHPGIVKNFTFCRSGFRDF